MGIIMAMVKMIMLIVAIILVMVVSGDNEDDG